VRLPGAQIGGNLDCGGGVFKNPAQKDVPESGKAVNAESAEVKGTVFLSRGYVAEGEVRLQGAQIGGDLDCSGGAFKNLPKRNSPRAAKLLMPGRANVKGSVFLRGGFTAEGEVGLVGAQIAGDLSCSGGTLKNPPQKDVAQSGYALNADQVSVAGSVFLRDDFTAEGQVRLPSARIGKNLECSGGHFKNPLKKDLPESGDALNAGGVKVGGGVFLREGFTAEGGVLLLVAQIGADLDCRGSAFGVLNAQDAEIGHRLVMNDMQGVNIGTIDLRNASSDVLIDDEESWPAKGKLLLDGLVYGRISVGPLTRKHASSGSRSNESSSHSLTASLPRCYANQEMTGVPDASSTRWKSSGGRSSPGFGATVCTL